MKSTVSYPNSTLHLALLCSYLANSQELTTGLNGPTPQAFQDPRDGRVKAFPIQATQGNYSICIYDLQKTDLGSYLCKLRNDCFKVELSAADGGLRENTKLLIYILICGAIPICFLCFYCYMQCLQFRQERLQDAMTLECEN
ncbi:uncharacterized protein PAE49_009565 isoform 2-T2 [Odontesthes bonariensis]